MILIPPFTPGYMVFSVTHPPPILSVRKKTDQVGVVTTLGKIPFYLIRDTIFLQLSTINHFVSRRKITLCQELTTTTTTTTTTTQWMHWRSKLKERLMTHMKLRKLVVTCRKWSWVQVRHFVWSIWTVIQHFCACNQIILCVQF